MYKVWGALVGTLAVAGAFMVFSQENTYVSKVVVDKPLAMVWAQLSEPSNYARLYPNWIRAIKKTGDNAYFVEDQFGKSYPITVVLSREFGVVDLHIGNEASRLRLFELGPNSTVVVHLAKKWDGIGWLGWFFHKVTTDRDLKNAKRQIEETP